MKKPVYYLLENAKRHGRDYIIPDDVRACLKNKAPLKRLRRELLGCIGGANGKRCEQPKLCAFLAWRGDMLFPPEPDPEPEIHKEDK